MLKLLLFAGFMSAIILVGNSCSGPMEPQSLDISVHNETPLSFDEVKLQWGTHLAWVSGSTLSPSNFMTILGDCERPPSDTAEVHFVEQNGRRPHSIKLNVSALKAFPIGKHEVVISITGVDQGRLDIDGPPCRYNLLVIEATKQIWAWGKPSNSTPSWSDLRSRFPQSWTNGMPVCPSGGVYTISKVGEPPICSLGGLGHQLQ
jgi:hypothetical protein